MRILSVVLPVMNEEENIPLIHAEIEKYVLKCGYIPEIIFVCDPSSDNTKDVVEKLALEFETVRGIYLADRAGQTEAIRAGYESACGSAVISMDADFQDPPQLIPEIINAWENGALIVHTKRGNRKTDKLVYRLVTLLGYRTLGWLTNGRVQSNVGDFRLIDASVLPLILKFQDPYPFWRGITSLSGIPSQIISYVRPVRHFGSTKYSNKIGSPSIAARGLATFSNKPLEFLQSLGIVSVFFSIFAIVSIIALQIFFPGFPRGIPTIIVLISVFFSIQFFSTAIIATYLIVLIEQTRRRPNYFTLGESGK